MYICTYKSSKHYILKYLVYYKKKEQEKNLHSIEYIYEASFSNAYFKFIVKFCDISIFVQ